MSANPLSSILCSAALASGLVSAEAIEYAQRLARHRLAQAGEPNDTIPDKLLAEILVEQEFTDAVSGRATHAGPDQTVARPLHRH